MRLIAFYLPQFHPIPENDEWWGKGFTEWTNVAEAKPLFPWHEQPFLPGELGFYDLRLPEIRHAQAELARAHGIDAFCYYHYWFGGRLLLERPFEEVLATGQPDFPFCLCWANENWTRAWDGLERDVLIRQEHSDEDDRNHLRWFARAFRDPRYLRVRGRPLLLVYRTSLLPDPSRTAAIWREEARALGIEEPLLCCVESLRDDRADPRTIGFDAAVEFQPDWLNVGTPAFETEQGNRVFDYEAFVERQLAKKAPDYLRFPCVTPNWDNTARRQKDAFVMRGSTPQLYGRWLEAVVDAQGDVDPEESLIFLNSWNEWGEGAQLEPTRRWGRAYLEATRRAARPRASELRAGPEPRLAGPQVVRSRPKVSVCIPTCNGANYLPQAIQSILGQTTSDFEVIVVDDASEDETVKKVRHFTDSRISFHQNASRLGIAGNWNRCVEFASAPFFCLFHQDDLMMPANLETKIHLLESQPRAGMVYSSVWQIGGADELISECWTEPPNPAEHGVHDGKAFFRRLLRGPNLVCAPSVMARREVFDVVGGFDPELPFTLDWEMWLRIASRFDVGYLAVPLVKYRRHAGMETNRFGGVRDFEHSLRAKLVALRKAADWIPDTDALRKDVIESYLKDAADRAAGCLREGQAADAVAYLRLALELDAVAENGEPSARSAERLLGEIVRRGDQRGGGPADESTVMLPEQLGYWETLAAARAVELSHAVTAQELARAIGLKAARKPGFGWVSKLIGRSE